MSNQVAGEKPTDSIEVDNQAKTLVKQANSKSIELLAFASPVHGGVTTTAQFQALPPIPSSVSPAASTQQAPIGLPTLPQQNPAPVNQITPGQNIPGQIAPAQITPGQTTPGTGAVSGSPAVPPQPGPGIGSPNAVNPSPTPGTTEGMVPAVSTPTTSSAGLQAPIGNNGNPTIEEVAAFLVQFRQVNDIEEATKQEVIAKYEELIAELKGRNEEERIYKDLEARAKAAPLATTEARFEKDNFRPKQIYQDGFLTSETARTLQSYLAELQASLQAATDGRLRIEAIISSREGVRKELPRQLSEKKTLAVQLSEDFKTPEGMHPRLREATLLLHHARQSHTIARIRRLEQEQRTYDAEIDLLSLQAGNYARAEKHFQSKVKDVTDELNKRRESLIVRFKSAAERLAGNYPNEFEIKIQGIIKNADEWLNLAKDNISLRVEKESLEEELASWTKRFTTMKERISSGGANSVVNFNSMVGLMLRRQRSELPNISDLQVKLNEYQLKAVEAQSMMLRLEDWRAANTQRAIPEAFRTAQTDNFAQQSPEEKRTTLSNFENHVVEEFRNDTQSRIEQLFALDDSTVKLIEVVQAYRSFIDEHILWIRSTEPFGAASVKGVWPAVQWLFKLDNWREVPHALVGDFKQRYWGYCVGFGLLLLWLAYIPKFRKELISLGEIAKRPNCTVMYPTLRAFICTLIISSPLALIALCIGWRLNNWEGMPLRSENASFASSVGMGLMIAARYYFPLEFIRQFCRSGGLAENHFQWSPTTTSLLRGNLRWFIDLTIPNILLLVVLNYGDGDHENSLGRVFYACSMCLSAYFLLRILKPKNGVFTNFLRANQGGWIDRLRYIWYTLVVSSPVALLIMSLMGYHYTSTRLSFYLHTTFVTLSGILVLSCFVYRWLLLKRRELLVAQAKQRLEEARRRDPNSPLPAVTQTDTHVDLTSINKQTVQLITSVFFFGTIAAILFIWSGVLPAVQMLDSFTPFDENHSEDAITLRDIFLAIPVGIMTVVSARNLPGLLEIVLLQHLPLENAVRYAITSISRYAIFVIGIVFTSSYLGIEWSSVQWLVAALGVGLGFGLQEIFANFVSGLILLFEQPVRVGDIITLGDTTGTVSRIRMRATTITNFDQQELIIPNKDLVTGRLLNWTLSDTTSRIVMNIGISYETDVEKACSILQDICNKHPNVLREPSPTVFVERFDECRLEITIRCFLASIDQRFPTRHEIYLEMRRQFAKAGITLWLPQREVYTRTEAMKWREIAEEKIAEESSDEEFESNGSDGSLDSNATEPAKLNRDEPPVSAKGSRPPGAFMNGS